MQVNGLGLKYLLLALWSVKFMCGFGDLMWWRTCEGCLFLDLRGRFGISAVFSAILLHIVGFARLQNTFEK
jgi:hypothetical protein